MTGSDGTGPLSPDEMRARQERELEVDFALASMEDALAREASQIGAILRGAGIELDPLTFVVMRVLEACMAELIDPVRAIDELWRNGSLGRSADLAAARLGLDSA